MLWSRDGFALVLDDGGGGLTTVDEGICARLAVAKKGYMDAQLILETSGSYSSRSPAHSGIGVIAGMIVALELADEREPQIRFSLQTSQAVDIIKGGDKVNALAETVSATVHYRIAFQDSLDIVKNKITHLLEPIGRKHKIKVEGFGK
ncbi:MAG: hypothetical protein Q9161_007983 [Pseudevernia consocians]